MITYTIKPGETLSGIARKYKTTIEEIMAVNPSIRDPNLIYAGAALTIPRPIAPPRPMPKIEEITKGVEEVRAKIPGIETGIETLRKAKEAGMSITPATTVEEAQRFLGAFSLTVPPPTPIKTPAETDELAKAKTELAKTEENLKKTLALYLEAVDKAKEDPFLSNESRVKEVKEITERYSKKAEQELTKIMTKYSGLAATDPELITQLEKMAEAGFPMKDIQTRIKDITAEKLFPLEYEIKEWTGRYLEPEIIARYKALGKPYEEFIKEQIAWQKEIPEMWKKFYYGAPEKIGELGRLKLEADADKKRIEERMARAETDLRSFYDLAVSDLKVDLSSKLVEIEDQRERTKTYLAGQLAKLGALQTTGAAAESLSNLEVRYNQIKADTQTKYSRALTETGIRYKQQLINLIEQKEDVLAKISVEVGKTEKEIATKIMDYEFKADEKIAGLSEKYLSKMFDLEKYAITESKKKSAEFIERYFNIVSGGVQTNLLNQVLPKIIDTKKEDKERKERKEDLEIMIKQKGYEKKEKPKVEQYKTGLLADKAEGMPYEEAITTYGAYISKDWIDWAYGVKVPRTEKERTEAIFYKEMNKWLEKVKVEPERYYIKPDGIYEKRKGWWDKKVYSF